MIKLNVNIKKIRNKNESDVGQMSDNKTIKKSIRITAEQDKNWDPDLIRDLLSGNFTLVHNSLMSDINYEKSDQNVGQKGGSAQMSDNFKLPFLELFSFLKEVSKSRVLQSQKNYDKWVELVNKRKMNLIDDAKDKLVEEGLLDE